MKKTLLLILVLLTFSLNSVAQSWVAKTPVPANELLGATSFTIGTNGYVVTGSAFSGTGSSQLWEYNTLTDSWSTKTNFPGQTRNYAVAFSIGTKGYVGTGYGTPVGASLNDFWEWDQYTDTWQQKTNFPGTNRRFCYGFAIDSLGYVGGGWDNSGLGGVIKKDFWSYSPATDSWTSIANLPDVRYGGFSFTIGSNGYICGGDDGSGVNFSTDLLEYNVSANTWTPKASLPSTGGQAGRGRNLAFSFSIGSKGYIGTGTFIPSGGGLPAYCSDFWEWDQLTDTWTNRASFPGGNRQWTIGFGIGSKGYAGTGEQAGVAFNDLWEYSAITSGIENNFSENNFSIFTSFENGKTILHVNTELINSTVVVYNLTGEIQFKSDINNKLNSFDLSNLNSGVYLVCGLNNESVLFRKKIAIVR